MNKIDVLEKLSSVDLSALEGMELTARLVVDGITSGGLHKSPYHGFSVEFAEHRQYAPGDEIRHIDWKVYGKSDRYYVKKFEEETNLRAYILLDASQSMSYNSSDGTPSKFKYACYLAATLAHFLLKQGDSVGLSVFDTKIRKHIPPRSTASHLQAIISTLENLETQSETKIGEALQQLAKRIGKRGLVVIISDLLDEPQKVLQALRHFRHMKHEVLTFHLFDRAEKILPFQGKIRFKEMETGETVIAEAEALQANYAQKFEQFIENYRKGCLGNQIDYLAIETTTPFDRVILNYLEKRKKYSLRI